MGNRVVVFVCPHGAAKSRIAAAWFTVLSVPGWSATSAGVTPQPVPSRNPARMLAGTPALRMLDEDRPRPLDAVSQADLVVAIDCAADVAADAVWQLTHQEFDAAMETEIRGRVHALAAELSMPERS
jgi:protein-tyrosine-phosphatase